MTFTLHRQRRGDAGFRRSGGWRGSKLMAAIADETTRGNPPLALRAGLRPRLAFLRRVDFHLGSLASHLGKRVFASQRALRVGAGMGIRRRAANGAKSPLGICLDGNGLTFAHSTSFHAAAAIGHASKFNRPAVPRRPRAAQIAGSKKHQNRSRYTNRRGWAARSFNAA